MVKIRWCIFSLCGSFQPIHVQGTPTDVQIISQVIKACPKYLHERLCLKYFCCAVFCCCVNLKKLNLGHQKIFPVGPEPKIYLFSLIFWLEFPLEKKSILWKICHQSSLAIFGCHGHEWVKEVQNILWANGHERPNKTVRQHRIFVLKHFLIQMYF